MTGERLRAWFLRNLLEAAERELGSTALAQLPARVAPRLQQHLSLERLRSTAALDAIPLDEGEEAVLAFEQTLGDGSGRLLERVACEMLARQLAQATGAVRIGDLYGTVARLRGPLEHPFIDATIAFELQRTPLGLSLVVGVAGRPRATRVLGHLAAAAIEAAERFARESHADPLRVELETIADRARIEARFRRASTLPPGDSVPTSARRSLGPRLVPSLSDEVERILRPSRSMRAVFTDEPATLPGFEARRARRSDPPARPGSVPPPPPSRTSERPPPASDTPLPSRISERPPPPSRRSEPPPPSGSGKD